MEPNYVERSNMDRNEILTKIWAVYEAGGLLTACAWCARLEIGGQWTEAEPRLLSTIDQPMTVSHSICPRCEEAARLKAAQFHSANPLY
jgi:hypothetical protein